MKVRYTLPAARELVEVLGYIRERSPRGARNVLARIKEIEALIARFPETGTAIRFGLRQISTTPYPYVIFYEIAVGEVVVHRIRHGARNPG